MKINKYGNIEEKDTGDFSTNNDYICQDCKSLIYGIPFFIEGKMYCTYCHERYHRLKKMEL